MVPRPLRSRPAAARDLATSAAKLLPLLALAACAGGDGDKPAAPGDDTAADTGASIPQPPDLPAAACGLSHSLLPTEGLGSIVAIERDPSLSLTAAGINGLLASQGLSALLTAEYDVDTYRVRYTTQDRGALTEASGLVVLPKGAGSVPTLLWAHPTVGFTDACAPSATGLEGAAFPILFASTGMAVAAPDYLGMNGFGAPSTQLHPYIIAEPTAIASLDSVRALFEVQAGAAAGNGTTADPLRLVHWGASEGGFAALWADRYQQGYAPEFRTIATIAAVPPTDIKGLARYGATTLGPTAAGFAGVLVGMNDWYRADDLGGVLQPGPAAALPTEVTASCSDFPTLEAITSLDALFTPAAILAGSTGDWSALPDWGCRMTESSLLGSPIPRGHDAPVFIVTAEDDNLVVAEPTRSDIPRLCDEGYDITYMECAGAGHVDGAINSLPEQWAWLQDRLAGQPVTGACAVPAPVECPDIN